jgi:hypothetical protein
VEEALSEASLPLEESSEAKKEESEEFSLIVQADMRRLAAKQMKKVSFLFFIAHKFIKSSFEDKEKSTSGLFSGISNGIFLVFLSLHLQEGPVGCLM